MHNFEVVSSDDKHKLSLMFMKPEKLQRFVKLRKTFCKCYLLKCLS